MHHDGSVWCGGEGGQIYRIDPGGQKVREVAHAEGFVLGIAPLREVPDGLAFDALGNLYYSCYAPSRIYKIGADRIPAVLLEDTSCHLLSNCTKLPSVDPNSRHSSQQIVDAGTSQK